MRTLVSIRTIKALDPIPGADQIHTATVDGWKIVVRKDEGFAVGDKALYLEVDSLAPSDDTRFSFLEKTKFRVRTIKLRKQISQGILLPLSKLTSDELDRMNAGESLTEILRVQKYEPPLPIQGEQKGTFPTHLVPKTDQERVQNIPEVLEGAYAVQFEITEKLDGTSCTIYHFADPAIDPDGDVPNEMRSVVGVCSRNWEMKLDDDNVYAQVVKNHDLVAKLRKLDRNIAIQGEIIGPRIQGNKYQRAQQEFYVFDIYDIDTQAYLPFWERWDLTRLLGLTHVPILREEVQSFFNWDVSMGQGGGLGDEFTLESVLAFADGKSMLNPQTIREGLVFKATDGSHSFKAISNKFLLRTGE